MPELTPKHFENIFFSHIKSLTIGRTTPDKTALRLQSFDYQFSDRWLQNRVR